MPTLSPKTFARRCLLVVNALQRLQHRCTPAQYASIGDVINRVANVAGVRKAPPRVKKDRKPREKRAKGKGFMMATPKA